MSNYRGATNYGRYCSNTNRKGMLYIDVFFLLFLWLCFYIVSDFIIDFSGFIIVNAKTMLMFTLIGL